MQTKHSASLFTAVLVLALVAPAAAQSQVTSLCDLRKESRSFNKKQVTLRGYVNLEFEDFSFNAKECPYFPGVGLMFGGDGVMDWEVKERKPGKAIKVHGVRVPLEKDGNLKRFSEAIQVRNGRRAKFLVTATLTGTFFAGRYGWKHLLVISKVQDIVTVERKDELSGVVLNHMGEGLPDVIVKWNESLLDLPAMTRTDPDGRFHITGNPWLLHLSREDLQPMTIRAWPDPTEMRIELRDSKSAEWNILSCADVAKKKKPRVGKRLQFPEDVALPAKEELLFFQAPEIRYWPDPYLISNSPTVVERWIRGSSGKVVGLEFRGRLESGGYWRIIEGATGEVARYRTQSARTVKSFDRILDAACVAEP